MRRVLVAVLSAGTLVLGSTAANADPPKPDSTADAPWDHLQPDQRARVRAQDRARTAADVIRRAADRGGAEGLTDIGLDEGSVRLRYRGELPPALRSAVESARATAPVEVLPAEHTLAELRAASDRVVGYLRAHPGGPAHRVSVRPDGSGLLVGVDATAARDATALPDVGVPVEVVAQDRVRPRGRNNDTSPFYGGGVLSNDAWRTCTAGFGVRDRDNREYVLTAGHCGYPGQRWYNGTHGQVVGVVSHEDVGQDLMMIPTNTDPWLFTGVGASTAIGHVIGWQGVYTGEELCSSGAGTTWLCGHVVVDAGNSSYCGYDMYGNWECYSGLVLSRQEDGAQAARDGDSGGPVVLPTASGIVAKGVISGAGGNQLLWQDFATAARIWGVDVVTT
ncbi:trypsin-like serine protease [Saccharothrix syringae]|uniref:Trypsin-like serine protease n=1 Tax=Saccharothrix syringae TaxID=103733 RepID=A0A5Q0H4H9_SACSY|nr:trypsin-like serine protease [Saccharothrix syringae]QFZ21039.1 trypsin-like serine protease [Saccharothrix syringae]